MKYGTRHRMRGGNFKSFIKKAGKWIKDHHVLSKAGKFLGGVVPGGAGKAIAAAGNYAGQHGYGRRRRRRRRVRRLPRRVNGRFVRG